MATFDFIFYSMFILKFDMYSGNKGKTIVIYRNCWK